MGAIVQLKKKEVTIPASPFCTVTSGCSFKPVMRLKEWGTGIVLDLCEEHGNALRHFTPHSYTTLVLPEGNHGT